MSDRFEFQPRLWPIAAVIASGASLSGDIDLGDATLGAIQMPAAWDAAALTFQGSHDGVTWQNVYWTGGGETSWTVAAGRFVINESTDDFRMLRYLRIRSGTAGAPVNQTATRTLHVMARQL